VNELSIGEPVNLTRDREKWRSFVATSSWANGWRKTEKNEWTKLAKRRARDYRESAETCVLCVKNDALNRAGRRRNQTLKSMS